MARKRILTLILVVLLIVVLIVVFATVFTVRNVELRFHLEDGKNATFPPDLANSNNLNNDSVFQIVGNKHIVTLSNNDILDKLNSQYKSFHALAVIKSFPNTVTVHFAERVAVFKLNFGAGIYVDSFGYICQAPSYDVIDITETFINAVPVSSTIGDKLSFKREDDNKRLDMTIEVINAVWQTYYAYSDIPKIINEITFQDDAENTNSSMTITTQSQAKIIIYEPQQNLSNRMIKALSVVYSDIIDMQKPGVVISVSTSGHISSEIVK